MRHGICLLALGLVLVAGCHGGIELVPLVGTPEERAWLATNHHQLVYAPDPAYPPYEYLDPVAGVTRGMARELLNAVEKRLGVRFGQIRVDDFASILALAQSGKVAVVNAVTKTPERSRYLDFTQPVFSYDNVILVRRGTGEHLSLDMLDGKRVSFVTGYAVTEYCAETYPAIVQDRVPSDLHAILNVSYGISDAAVIDMASASWLIQTHGIQNLRIAGNASWPVALAIGVRRDLPVLGSLVRKALHAVTEQERESIRSRWIKLHSEALVPDWVVPVGALVLCAIMAVVIWNRLLHFQVRKKTTELQSALERLAASERDLRIQLDNAPDAILVYDIDLNRFVEANGRAVEMFGYSRERLLSMSPRDLYMTSQPDSLDPARSIAVNNDRVLAGERLVFQRVVTRADGRELLCEVRTLRHPPSSKRLIRASYLDRSAEHAAEEEKRRMEGLLLQRQKLSAIGTLANGVAHEINNPLMGIINYGQLILDRVDQSPLDIRQYADEIIVEGMRIAGIVRSLLSLSRQQQDAKEVTTAPALLDSIRTLVKTLLGKDEIEIRFVLADDLPDLVCAPGRIQQVLLNLITNARDALNERYPGYHPDKCVTVSVTSFRHEDGSAWMRFSVADTGYGIAPEKRDRIFDPFYTTKPIGTGTGLGLPLCYGIISEHGGRIWYEEAAFGGACFSFEIPL